MTMIVTAHLGDSILIATDKRSMSCDLETGSLKLFQDNTTKIKIWSRGAFVGTGEAVFLNRIEEYFVSIDSKEKQLKQMDIIFRELKRRLEEGVPEEFLMKSEISFSLFNGQESLLYSIPISQFFQVTADGYLEMVSSELLPRKEYAVGVSCFRLPSDMSVFQNFQRNIRPLSSFESKDDFLKYYIQELKVVFTTQASIDPSITTSFDLYLQSCETGQDIGLYVENPLLGRTIPQDLNYLDFSNI